jgi:hypothetical protein
MPASTPVRVAIVIAALVALLAGYRWWSNPERHIQKLLSEVASALSHDSSETDLRALTAVASLQEHLLLDVSVDMGGGATPLRGRQEVIATAARLRASTRMLRVQFFDADITLTGDSTATTRVTVQLTTREAAEEEVAAAHDVTIALVRAAGRWQIASARVGEQGAAL